MSSVSRVSSCMDDEIDVTQRAAGRARYSRDAFHNRALGSFRRGEDLRREALAARFQSDVGKCPADIDCESDCVR